MMRSRPVSSAGHVNYNQTFMSPNGERYDTKVYLYAGGVSLEGVDDGHVYSEVRCEEIWQRDWQRCWQLTEKRLRN
jgi:hypothetical protein